ncbi:hypothetical protein [Sulfurimonas marina]|uniref:Uncharacterized protein n=1 Tax=Sulfurimonas marina TaxID=2590551 RepID=A0A7M1ATM5_9BACT|nr:hypothetical protein [Sulfurimonas marina]QOP40773.1 hypothetical protein FJR03_03060 [Sulfurimonas marina]
MSKVLEYIKANELAWQPSFNGAVGDLEGYRGALIVEEGKQLSPDRKLPPKIQAKQVIMVCDDEKMKFLTCELDSFNDFAPMYAKYKEFFSPEGVYVLYVTDLDGSGTFEYEGVTFTAYPLDESSVWNEILELVDLEKGDMKKLSAEEKIETLFDEVVDNDTTDAQKTYDAMCELIGESSKQLMGAV